MEIFHHLRLKVPVVVACHLTFLATTVIASDFEMSLQVKSAKQQADTKHTEEQPSPTKPQSRLVFTTDSKETLLVSWKATNMAKQTTFRTC